MGSITFVIFVLNQDRQHTQVLADDQERCTHLVRDYLHDELLLLQTFLQFLRHTVNETLAKLNEMAIETFKVDPFSLDFEEQSFFG